MIELEHSDIRNSNRTGYAIGGEPHYIGTCFCGEGIAEGEEYYTIDGKLFHKECFDEYVEELVGLLSSNEKAKLIGAERIE